ncbi:SRPBCC family protein [Streptomyces ortus]|uniref:SRPBCC domain-containing protein n=1 Tax=Streptomyces ortus TaxID=2867268 RepID=A0ABT3V639_9ACTN|nr:SRPBCC domain-containing protein [Streptomyces ortus]MCX4235052.1 SRPBCC domain-containing protein [Streptomyces ortus]
MDFTNEFRVNLPPDEAWALLTDVERIAPCMPGAQLTGVDGDAYNGVVKVKVGPMTIQYKGVVSFEEKDDAGRTAVLHARGRDTRGQGNADARVTARLVPDDSGTRVTVDTRLTITGRVAQFGKGMIEEISGRLLAQFVDNLETRLATERRGSRPAPTAAKPLPQAPTLTTAPTPAPVPAPTSAPKPMEGPATGPATEAYVVPAAGPATGPDAGLDTGPDSGPAPGPGTGPESGPATGPALGPGSRPEAGRATGPEAGPANRPAPGPGAEVAAAAPASSAAAPANGSAADGSAAGAAREAGPAGPAPATPGANGVRPAATPTAPVPVQPLDLMSVARGAVLKRALPAVLLLAVLVIALVVWLTR